MGQVPPLFHQKGKRYNYYTAICAGMARRERLASMKLDVTETDEGSPVFFKGNNFCFVNI